MIKFLYVLLVLPIILTRCLGLHFYLETGETKCFFEDLPRDTIVVAKLEALELSKKEYIRNPNLVIEVTIEETFDNDQRVVQQQLPSNGGFTFTSIDSGEHKYCITPKHTGNSWLDTKTRTRIFLDLAIGEAAELMESTKTGTVNVLKDRVRHLNSMLEEISRHQLTIRGQEDEFKQDSEKVSWNVVKWTLIQILMLLLVGRYQIWYLKNYFKREKVV